VRGGNCYQSPFHAFVQPRPRDRARNIRSGWSKAVLYPFQPRRILYDVQEAPAIADLGATALNAPMQPLLSPTLLETPTNAMSLAARQRKLEERPEPVSGVDHYLQKALNATQRAFAERELLTAENQELVKQNNEKRTHQHVEERKIGEAKIMDYEDIVEALKVRIRKEPPHRKKRDVQKTLEVSKPRAKKTRRTIVSEV